MPTYLDPVAELDKLRQVPAAEDAAHKSQFVIRTTVGLAIRIYEECVALGKRVTTTISKCLTEYFAARDRGGLFVLDEPTNRAIDYIAEKFHLNRHDLQRRMVEEAVEAWVGRANSREHLANAVNKSSARRPPPHR